MFRAVEKREPLRKKMDELYQMNFINGKFRVYTDRPVLDLIQVKQEHTNHIVEYSGSSLDHTVADGIISSQTLLAGKALAIKTADCLPVLFVGEKVALVHAGWRGLSNGILHHDLLIAEEWSEIVIGPSIHYYEVQPDFKENFPDSPHFSQRNNQYFFNLQAEAIDQLKSKYPDARIKNSEVCTWENSRYNSYRRDKTKKRNWNLYIKE